MATLLQQLLLLILAAVASPSQGCQFYPHGDYLRFVRVPEDVQVGGEILRVQVHPRGQLSVQPMDKEEDAQYFVVSPLNSSWVSVALARSLEELVDSDLPQSVLKFRLACADPHDDSISSYLSVTVYVEDVNDHAPSFLGTPYQVTVDELTPIGLTIFRGIHAVDRDKPNTPNSDVQYSLAAGNEAGHFALESSHRAALVLRSPLDFDAGDALFNLTVVASDRGSPANNASTTVTVRVRDNDDLSPRFTRDVYRVRIPEMTLPEGTLIHHEVIISPPIHAEDQDYALNASVRYDIVAGNALELFWLDPDNGSLFVRRALDRETLKGERFTLTLRASQKDNPERHGSARLEITVLDLNDNEPKFEVEVYNISIVENLPNGFSVLQVAARDPDKGENGEFHYELDDPQNAFSIDARSGWLMVRDQTQLDRERTPALRMRVRALEKNRSSIAVDETSAAAIQVTLLDANDNNPAFQPSNVYHFTISADATVGEVVGQVCATDPDLGRNGHVTYDVTRANTSDDHGRPLPLPFSIEEQSGLILVVESPLREDRYTLLVEAADQPSNPSERRVSLAVATIDVLKGRSATERAMPDFLGAPYEFWVGGSVMVGTTVGLVRVKNIDKKAALYDLLHSYRLGVPFAVEERSGVITVVKDLSKFSRPTYEFEAVVTDGHVTLVTNVTIHVVTAEENVPRGQPESLEFKVRENQSGALIGRLPVPERRRGPTGTKFLLVNKDLSDLFTISNDGNVYTKRGLDREEHAKYHLTIITENRAIGKGEGIYQVTVTVEDENDNAPKFDNSFYEGHISEDATAGTQVKLNNIVHAQDVDMGSNAIFALKLRGEGSYKFRIDQESGKIFLATKNLDREVKQKYELTVVASDRGNLSSEAQLYIYVDDVNDNAPNFVQMELLEEDGGIKSRRDVVFSLENTTRESSTSPTVTLDESVTIGTSVVRIFAQDNDTGENAVVTYRLTSEKQHSLQADRSVNARHKKERFFAIHPSTGEITVAKRLPAETSFQMNVMASDCCGLSNNITVTVAVLDVNDHAPSFRRPWYTYDLAEGSYEGWVLGWLHASDADFGENAVVTYYIDPEEHDLPFSVSPSGGALTATGDVDREFCDSYEFRVWAEDNGNPKLKTSVQVEVNILDVNDNSPMFYNYNRLDDVTGLPIYYAAIEENGPPGQIVTQVFANDSDYTGNGNGLLLYSISGPPTREFHIDSKDGTVTTITSLDYETTGVHNITVIASDLGSPTLSSTAILLVAVKDQREKVSESNPMFIERHFEVEVVENSPAPVALMVLNVSELYRHQPILYTLVAGSDTQHFYVDSRNGTLYLMTTPDRERQSYYVVRVHAEKMKRGRHNRPVLVYPLMEDDSALSGDEARVVVHVRDDNDNPPQFEGAGRPVIAAIPSTASYGDEIVRLQAHDPDEGLNGEVRYEIMSKADDSEPRRFDVHPVTGQVRGIVSFARDAGRVFGFDVRARDRRGAADGQSSIANVIVYVLDEQKQLVMVVGAKPVEAERKAHNITRALNDLTGLDVRVRKLEPHFEPDSTEDTHSTDLYLYAVDPQMNMIVDTNKLERLLGVHAKDIKRNLELFQAMEVRELPPPSSRAPRPALLAVEVGAVALGIVVFLGALASAICFGCVRRRKRMKKRHTRFPSSHMGFTMRPPYLVEVGGAGGEDGTTDSYIDMQSQASSPRHHSVHGDPPVGILSPGTPGAGALKLSRAPSSARLQRPLASVTSMSRHDSGIALEQIQPTCFCSSGQDSSSSNGSYEDSLKSLHQPGLGAARHALGVGDSGVRRTQRRRQREPSTTPPPPPKHGHKVVGALPGAIRMPRRNSERIVICPLDHHRRDL